MVAPTAYLIIYLNSSPPWGITLLQARAKFGVPLDSACPLGEEKTLGNPDFRPTMGGADRFLEDLSLDITRD